MKKQCLSFRYAAQGIWYVILHEGHFRFHLVAAAYVVFFGIRFYDFCTSQWAALALLIAAVLASECVNTSLERLCDRVCSKPDPLVKTAKDTAAGAVLITAVAAAAIAVLFFWDTAVFAAIWRYYTAHIGALILLLLSGVIAVLFIMLTPKLFGVGSQTDHQKKERI